MRSLRAPVDPPRQPGRYAYTPQTRRAPADPAPTRWSYRAQRLWLTPLFRSVLRVGVPLCAGLGLFVGYFAQAENRQALIDGYQEIWREVENRPEFRVNLLGITGASDRLVEDIRTTLALDLPVSSFDLDLDVLRARVEALPAVRAADLRIQGGGYLAVQIEERAPAFVWQTDDGPVLLDAEGAYVASLAERALTRPLPAVAGEGADRHLDEARRLYASAAPLGDQVRGLVRIGARRWDLVLTDGRRVLLPSERPVAALDRVLALHDVTELFERDVIRVDLRNAERPTVQLSPEALVEYRRLQQLAIQTGDDAG